MLGRMKLVVPVCRNSVAGPCATPSVCMQWTKHEVVHVLVDVREEIRCPVPALAVLLEVPQRLHHPLRRALAGLGHRARVVEVDHLSVSFEQLRLVIKRVHMAHAARHEEEDDPLRLRRVMRFAQRERTGRAVGEGCERERAEATGARLQKLAA